MRDDDESLPNELSAAIELLRAAEPVRAAWRAEVLRRAAATRRAPFRVSMSVPWAIAAESPARSPARREARSSRARTRLPLSRHPTATQPRFSQLVQRHRTERRACRS